MLDQHFDPKFEIKTADFGIALRAKFKPENIIFLLAKSDLSYYYFDNTVTTYLTVISILFNLIFKFLLFR